MLEYWGHFTIAGLGSIILLIIGLKKLKKRLMKSWSNARSQSMQSKQHVSPQMHRPSVLMAVVFRPDHHCNLYSDKLNSEQALHKMLPRIMMNHLKQGWQLRTECFNEVTVLSASIMNLAEIMSRCPAIQFPTLLDLLASMWTTVLAKYDGYHVATGGDQLLAVSGAPTRNGTEHARQLARAALELRRLAQQNKVTEMACCKIKLTIGLHSGPCTLTWFGMRHRYFCLTGPVVYFAAKLEAAAKDGSTAKRCWVVSQKPENTIKISNYFFKKLEAYHAFRMSYNAEVYIKGVGFETTYLLEAEHLELLDGRLVIVQGLNVYIAHQVPTSFEREHTPVKYIVEWNLPLPEGLKLIQF